MFAQETVLLVPRGCPAASWSCRRGSGCVALGPLGTMWGCVWTVYGHLLARPTKEVRLETDRSSVEQLTGPSPGAINRCLITKQVEKLQDQGSGFSLFV